MATMVVTQSSMVGVAACFLALLSFGSVLESAAAEDTGMYEEDYNVDNCHDTYLPNYFDNVALSRDPSSGALSFNADMVVADRILPGTGMKFSFSKCVTRDDLNCNKIYEGLVNDLCEKLAKKDLPWTSLIESMQREGFEAECPTKPGNFSVKHVLVPHVAPELDEKYKGYWLLEIEVRNNNTMHFCVEIRGVLGTTRRKRKKTRPAQ